MPLVAAGGTLGLAISSAICAPAWSEDSVRTERLVLSSFVFLRAADDILQLGGR